MIDALDVATSGIFSRRILPQHDWNLLKENFKFMGGIETLPHIKWRAVQKEYNDCLHWYKAIPLSTRTKIAFAIRQKIS
jgi:hypothetical protein